MGLKKNDIIDLTIETITNEGAGLGRFGENGFVVFVPFSVIGDVLKIRILKVTSSHAYGKIEQIIKPSDNRIESDCKAFLFCGGCNMRHMNYEAELNAKFKFIKDAFIRIGKLEPQFLPVMPNPNQFRYRNKAQYPVGKNANGEIIYGFYRSNSHDIVSCADCKLQPKIFNKIADYIIKCAVELKISVYNEAEHSGVLRHICIRKGHYSGEILLTFVVRRKTPEFVKLANLLMERFAEIKGVVLNINKDKTNVIFGNEEITLKGQPYITDNMCGLDVRISSKSFYQVNTPVAEMLYSTAKSFAEPTDKTILDLYCGVGTIGLSMADEAKKIIGVEIMQEAVKNAIFNAEANNIGNAEFICADTEKAELLKSGIHPDVVILDPSRKGCGNNIINDIALLNPERIVMISCNPSTAARDCKKFAELGYNAEKVQGFDLFSGTAHVECVVLMSRKDG